MKAKTMLAPGLVLLAGLAGYVLRRRELTSGFDAAGLNIPSLDAKLLVALSLAVAVLALVYALRQKAQPAWDKTFPKNPALALLRMISAAFLVGGSVITLSEASGRFALIVAALGVAAGACQLANDALYFQGKRPQPYGELVPAFYLICLLIYHFRGWSIDPVVLDYCFRLFALIGSLAGVFALGGYAFDRGRRGSTCLFCALGAYFCILSLADGGTAQMLIFAACALRLLIGLFCAAGAKPAPEEPEAGESPENA